MTRLSVLLIIAVLPGLVACSDDPPTSSGPTGTIAGSVRDVDTGEPVPGAELILGDRQAFAASDGTFRLEDVPADTHQLNVRHADYNPWTEIVEVRDDQETAVDLRISATARLSIALHEHLVNGLVPTGELLPVEFRIGSAYSITGATARVSEASVELEYVKLPVGRDLFAWVGDVPLSEIASPTERALVVVARNANGDSARASFGFRFDRLPVVTVEIPVLPVVATPSTRIRATCTDDDPAGCRDVFVWAGEGMVAHADGNVLDQDVSFQVLDGQLVFARIIGQDRAGLKTEIVREIFVESSPALTRVADAGTGLVIGADASRLLVLPSRTDSGSLILVDRATGARTTLYAAPYAWIVKAVPVTGGVVLFLNRSDQTLYQWRNGAVEQLATGLDNSEDFLVEGDWAWYNGIRRNLVTGAVDATGRAEQFSDIGPNGNVVYGRPDIFLDSAGVVTQLTSGFFHQDPITDGINVLYRRQVSLTDMTRPHDIVLHTPEGGLILSTLELTTNAVWGRDYQAGGGWVAFVRNDLGGMRQVWSRSPAGQERQLSIENVHNEIELVHTDGTVVFAGFSRYRASPGGEVVRVGSALGQPVFIDGQLHVMIGPALFRAN